MLSFFLEFLKVFVAVSIFFVWVPRYHNIVEEFKPYQYQFGFKRYCRYLKINMRALLVINSVEFVLLASGTLVILMSAAFMTHMRFKKQLSLVLSIAFTDNYECIYFLHDV
ncbi:MAG: hypothetical protein Ct9H90mP7_4890 [Candidatus Neomarinimicrobiota bacterium]|nr:MAG: hypothetical protein Ct9H90mP7_4890 [Candidatus Neomarinimicrobiota bacterium]